MPDFLDLMTLVIILIVMLLHGKVDSVIWATGQGMLTLLFAGWSWVMLALALRAVPR